MKCVFGIINLIPLNVLHYFLTPRLTPVLSESAAYAELKYNVGIPNPRKANISYLILHLHFMT